MPYIDPKARAEISLGSPPATAGELTFVFYREALRYIGKHGMRFATAAEIMAAFEGAKLEFYRRHVAKYEDKKIEENGDVT